MAYGRAMTVGRPGRSTARAAGLALLCGVVAAAALVTSPVADAAPVPPAQSTTAVAPPPARTTLDWQARRVAADGVRQWIECAGQGPVTVVVIAGLHADHRMWSLVLNPFARTTRTCIYDRPGLGDSPPRSPHGVVTAGQHADELWALLGAAHEPGPYVVVGHSYGGLVARAFTARHLSSVRGLVLVEGVGPTDDTSRYWGEGGDLVDTWASRAQASRLRLGSVPLVVEAAQDPDRSYWGGYSYGESAADLALWRLHQLQASYLSTQSAYVVVSHSAHVIEHDRPDAVVAGVRLIVRAVVGRTRMPSCALGAYGRQPRC